MKSLALLFTGLFISSLAVSQPISKGGEIIEAAAPTPEKVVTAAGDSDADKGIGKDSSFEAWVEAFENQFQAMGQSKGGRLFFQGRAPIRVSPMDPNYGKELMIAYERATLDLQAEFVLQTYGRLQSSKRLEFFEDLSTDNDQFPPVEIQKAQREGRLSSLFEKALGVLDKKLNSELIKQGVPQETVARMSVEQKKSTFKNNFTQEALKTAVSSMQGLVPVQTRIFTEQSSNGNAYVVGVIAVQSEKTRQFAKDMALKQPSQVRGEPVTLASILPEKKSGYLDEVGLRFTYDEKGHPMLLSFGRWSISVLPDWTPSRTVRAKQAASDTAQVKAETMIIEFMNTNIAVSNSTKTGSLEEEVVKQVTHFEDGTKKGSDRTREQLAETIDRVTKSVKADASGDLRGTSVVKRWEETDQNGILHVGVVVAWTYDQLDNANAIERSNSSRSSGVGATEGSAKSESRSSRIINRINDF